MASLALFTVRILKRLPRTASLDAHLNRCGALAVFYSACDPRIEPLRMAHVFRFVKFPGFSPRLSKGGNQWVHMPVPAGDSIRGNFAPIVKDASNGFQSTAHTVVDKPPKTRYVRGAGNALQLERPNSLLRRGTLNSASAFFLIKPSICVCLDRTYGY
jgi:hypothetical protein